MSGSAGPAIRTLLRQYSLQLHQIVRVPLQRIQGRVGMLIGEIQRKIGIPRHGRRRNLLEIVLAIQQLRFDGADIFTSPLKYQ